MSLFNRRVLLACIMIGIMIVTVFVSFNEVRLNNNNSVNPHYSVGANAPQRIHLTWLHDPATSINVVWETTTSTTDSTVKYGTTTSYGSLVTGTTDTTGVTSGNIIHKTELTGLTPGTTYHYICGDNVGSGGWSSDSTFKTGPSTVQDFTFTVCGDSRDNPTEWGTIVTRMNAVNPSFTMFSGDFCASDLSTDYDTWFQNWQTLGAHCAISTCEGNHESPATNYYHRLPMPGAAYYYSINYSSIHIIQLNNYQTMTSGSAQYNWLVNDLKAAAADTAHPWKIVMFHEPPYCAAGIDGHSPNTVVQTNWVPLFDQYHVDIVFNGHNHFYERTYPISGGSTPSSPTITDHDAACYKNPTGTVYTVSGGAGAPLYSVVTSSYIEKEVSNYNFVEVNVYANNSLHATTYQDDGTTVIDSFWIVKNTSPVVEITVVILPSIMLIALFIGIMFITVTRQKTNPNHRIPRKLNHTNNVKPKQPLQQSNTSEAQLQETSTGPPLHNLP